MKLLLEPSQFPNLKEKLIQSSWQEDYFILLDSNGFTDMYGVYDWIIAVGARKVFSPGENHFSALKDFHQERKSWLFGHLNYNLKNKLEDLNTTSEDSFEFPLMLFFQPEVVVYSIGEKLYAESDNLIDESAFCEWLKQKTKRFLSKKTPVQLKSQTSRDQYLSHIQSLKDHLQFGDIYEVNYCIEFKEKAVIEPEAIFRKLNAASPSPFAAFYKCKSQYLMCTSPERYLCKRGKRLVSQPIKGTAARSADPVKDKQLKTALLQSEKERSENVMIVDLVRNDLSHTAAKASVKVDELFGIYSYPAVHQMVSTVSSNLDDAFHFTDAIRYSFPMGSMTGAPKIEAMKIIDAHENFSRSLYSGSVGYIDPSGNFDFNVVIRSLLYNEKNGVISARVGSAITIHCEAEKEYEECLLKADKLFKALE